MKIAIICRPGNRSPKILAEALRSQFNNISIKSDIFYDPGFLKRLVSFKESGLSFHFWLKEKIVHFLRDTEFISKLKSYDAIILSECCPNGFWKSLYNIEKLKKLVRKPIAFYEVYYLGSAPSQISKLKINHDPCLERYDYHLSVSDVTEIKGAPQYNWFNVGIFAESWKLEPIPKNELIAIIDFLQPDQEETRAQQIRCLQRAGIRYLELNGEYSIAEIRSIYQQGAIFFLQFPEAFGISILENFCVGNQVFSPSSSWPMSWRKNEDPQYHEEGELGDCFTIYDSEEELMKKLLQYKETFDPVKSPLKVQESLIKNYPSFYNGSKESLRAFVKSISEWKKN